jgi:hypothetical protein
MKNLTCVKHPLLYFFGIMVCHFCPYFNLSFLPKSICAATYQFQSRFAVCILQLVVLHRVKLNFRACNLYPLLIKAVKIFWCQSDSY